ncbi:MAG: hypothetical protein JNK15_14340 [Planctomycetes bacterium]|nr:hypothetical protein [Planctomycetota bacterium]
MSHDSPHQPPDRPAPENAFPDERDWLATPLPDGLEPTGGSAAFVERTLQALRADRELDAAIAAEDRALPRILLTAHSTPPPEPDFVASTMAALLRERRQRWQHLLARHVMPNPSPDFVTRTLRALATVRPTPPVAARPTPAARRPFVPALLLAAAVAVAAWLAGRDRFETAPLELRLQRATPIAWAHADAGNPLAALLAAHEHRRDPAALAMAGPDGLWLALGGDR